MDLWFYLLPLGLIFDAAGYFPSTLGDALALILMGVSLCRRSSRDALRGGAGLLVVLVVRSVTLMPPLADRLLLLAAHQWIWHGVPRAPRGVIPGLLFFTGLHLFLFDSPHGYAVTESVASAANILAGALTGRAFRLGPTYQGMSAWLLMFCLSLFAWRRGDRIAPVRSIAFVLLAVPLSALAADLLLSNVPFDVDLTWNFSYREPFGVRQIAALMPNLAVLAMPAVQGLLAVALYALLHANTWQKAAAENHLSGRCKMPAIVVWLALMLVAVPPTAWRRPQPREIVFIERGIVSYSKPDDRRFGRGAGGMFGLLPEYARLFGCGATVTNGVPGTLDPQRQVLLFTNLNAPMPEAEHRRIWDFVEAGGGLWVIGDHTFIKDGRHHINDLLAPSDIALANDSAQFFPQGWFHSYRFPQGTPFGLLREDGDNRPGFLVGASLELSGAARPFMLGRFGYGDLGTDVPDETRGHLGDFKYQRDERLGDLPLVAGQRFGQGRVLVYGDTTSFFNHMMPGSCDLLRASLSWFGERPVWFSVESRGMRVVTVFLLLLFGALLAAGVVPGAVVVLAAGVAFSLLLHRESGQLPWDVAYARRQAAIIDFTHQPEASRHGNMPTGLHGVNLSLMRRGFLPLDPLVWHNGLPDMAACIVFNAPRRPFSAATRRTLHRYMEGGGTVIMTCGYPHYAVMRSFLEPLGLRVTNLPLGRFFDRQAFGQRISFFSAWPIELAPRSEAAVLSVYDDWPLIVSVPVGQGRLILIADSEFLQNRNLESSDRHDPANVRFVRELFERIPEVNRPW